MGGLTSLPTLFQALIRAVSRIYNVFWTLIGTALLSASTVAMWHFYQQARLQAQFRDAGKPVTVQIENTDRQQRQFWDVLGNFVYVGFTHQHKAYETRCVSDSAWLSAGDRLNLRYNARLDAFGQPQRVVTSGRNRVVSRLIGWTVFGISNRKTNYWQG